MFGESASSRLFTGSSISRMFAPAPVIAPPTPAARYVPPASVCHSMTAWESAAMPAPFRASKMRRCSAESIVFRVIRPNCPASDAPYDAAMIDSDGCLAKYQHGKRADATADFPCRGGTVIISRVTSPRLTCSRRWAISR